MNHKKELLRGLRIDLPTALTQPKPPSMEIKTLNPSNP